MSNNLCLGCGAVIQYEDPNASGYIPRGKKEAARLCQRCFQLRHYGKFKKEKMSEYSIWQFINKAIGSSELTVLVVDAFDPEGSLPLEWASLLKPPVLMVVNKADLIPPKTPWMEVEEWFRGLWEKRFPGIELTQVIALSAKRLGKKEQLLLLKEALRGKRVALVGTANAGKTSLLNALLDEEPRKKGKKSIPTVSSFPGTTQGVTPWLIRSYDIKLYDTPGLFPGTRMSDQLCPECVGRMLPENKLQLKIWELPLQDGVLFGALAGIWNLSTVVQPLFFFSSDRITLHRGKGEKIEKLMREAPEWLTACCPQDRLWKMEEKIISVPPGNDLYISGLGWVAVKKETAELRVLVPEGVEIGIRPSLIGKK